MLVGDGWAFLHIPKCGGTSVRSALKGQEVSEVLPMGDEASFSHRFHWIAKSRPPGVIFTLVRHPACWLESYWKMRWHEGELDESKVLDRLWSPDLDEFAARVVDQQPGYISRMFRAFTGAYPQVDVYRLEDGLEWLIGDDRRANRLDGPRIGRELRARLCKAERGAMERYQ